MWEDEILPINVPSVGGYGEREGYVVCESAGVAGEEGGTDRATLKFEKNMY